MKAKEIMTGAPLTCSPGTNLAAAAALMLDGDCGILPVVDHDKLVGVVTDRDLFIALGYSRPPRLGRHRRGGHGGSRRLLRPR